MSSDYETTIRSIYDRWNAQDIDGVLAAFAALGPSGYTIEYVGAPPLDGVAAVTDMWERYGGTCTTDLVELLVNGNEAAALIHNRIRHADGGETVAPSIETYRAEDGHLAVRYFHQEPAGEAADA